MRLWHFLFFGYVVWICGIMKFFYYFTGDGRIRIETGRKTDILIGIWALISTLAVVPLFPILILGPLYLVALANAPIWAGFITGGFAIFAFFLSMKMVSVN